MTQQKQKKLDPVAAAQMKDLDAMIKKSQKEKSYPAEEVKKRLGL